jgi:hypothetical protein
MGDATRLAAWLDFAEKLPPVALSILDEAQIPQTECGALHPKAVAAELVIRTVSNFRGVVALARARQVVEARVLVRCCIENTFYLTVLNARGAPFVREMFADARKSHTTLSELYLYDGSTLDAPFKDQLRTQLRELNRGEPEAKFLNITALARGSVFAKLEAFYRTLSADAAHPTILSLNRYIRRFSEEGEVGLVANPVVNDSELSQTLNWGCIGMISVCVAFNEGVDATPSGQELLPAIADQWEALDQMDR